MSREQDTLLKRAHSLGEVLVAATPYLLEGYSATPGSAHLRRSKLLSTQTKSSSKDLVTYFDKKVEDFLLKNLGRVFQNELIIGEETVAQKKLNAHTFLDSFEKEDGIWIFDPIDGTTNYSKAYPFFCVTAAYLKFDKNSKSWSAQVCATWNPITKELFWAAKNCGAWLGRHRLRVSEVKNNLESLWITGFASERSTDGQRPFDLFTKITKKTLGVRRDGSAALDLAYVASGRVEGYWEWGLAPWDIAAGALLVEEAGGRVTNLSGKKVDIKCGEIVATNSALHKWLLDSIKE